MQKRGYRIERDYLGDKKIPSSAYYGIQTQRAIENFPISSITFPKTLIHSIVMIKKAAAMANFREKRLERKKADAIIRASDEIFSGKFGTQFPLDIFQSGSGTSTHMNVNEVIANRALEILKRKKGSYSIINPNDHVNLAQSTNDVFHSAIHIAAYTEISEKLLPALKSLHADLEKKSRQWNSILKSGRTHLRDAVPMTLGEEFSGYSETIKKDLLHVKEDSSRLLELNLGGTAIGTKINTGRNYHKLVFRNLKKVTGYNFRQSKNLFEGTQSLGAITAASASLKCLAVSISKIMNDLRLLSSGPATGLNEIFLPAVQPGSSIMPAKINPSVPEMLNMVCFQVIGNDTTITLCSQAGQLELNVMMPLAAYDLLNSIEILSNGISVFTEKCLRGIKANEKKCREYLEKNPIIVTALTPYIGYQKSAEIAKLAYIKEKSVKEIVSELNLLDQKTLDKILDLKRLK